MDIYSQVMSRYLARKLVYGNSIPMAATQFSRHSNAVTDNLYFEMADALNFIISSELGWDDFLEIDSKCLSSLCINYEELVSEP